MSLTSRPRHSVSAGRFFASVSRQRLAQPRHGLLNEPWLPPASVSSLPTTYFFSPTRVRRELDELSPLRNDHKPPDERTLKLGKSEYPIIPTSITFTDPVELMLDNSFTNSLTPSVNFTVQYLTHQHSLSQCQPSPIPIHSSTSSYCQRTHPLPCSAMDCSSCVEQHTTCRQRETADPKRKDGTFRYPSRSHASW
jgi:hypothetical protein